MSLTPLSLIPTASNENSEIEGVLAISKETKITCLANDILPHDVIITSPESDHFTHTVIDDHPVSITQNKTDTLARRHRNTRSNSKALTTKYRDSLTAKTQKNRNSVDFKSISGLASNETRACQKITLDLIRNLRNTYNCLIQAHARSDLKIALNRKGFLELTSDSSYEPSDPDKMLIQQNIYMDIISALKSEIFNFFDDKGHFIDLKMLEGLTRVNFKFDTFIRENTAKAFQAYYPEKKTLFEDENKLKKFLEKLCIPENEVEKFNEHELFCIGILQRLYPENTDDKQHKTAILTTLPVFPPLVFLMVYKQFVSTPELLRIIKTLLEWPKKYIPTFQKVRLMNFLRTLVDSFSYRFEILNYKDEVMKILETGKFINFESMCLAGEIEDLMEFKGLPKKICGPNKLGDFLKDALVNNPIVGQYYFKMIGYIADDLKILAAESMASLTIEELYSDKKTGGPSSFQIHEDNLVNFIFSLFETDNEKRKPNIEAALRFCLYLAKASLEKNDYFTSYVIYTCLSNKKIEQLYRTDHQKKNSYLPHLKKHKKVELDPKSWEIHQELSDLFIINNNRAKMNREILESSKSNILVIPEITLIKTSLMRMADEFEAHSEDIRINMREIDIQTLHDTSDYKMKVESIMNNVLLFYKNSPDLQTDIGVYINDIKNVSI